MFRTGAKIYLSKRIFWGYGHFKSYLTVLTFNPFKPKSGLIDFTLSNTRQFYSWKGDPLAVKGFKTISVNHFKPKSDFIDFTLSNARRFFSSKGDPLGVKGLNYIITHTCNFPWTFCIIFLTQPILIFTLLVNLSKRWILSLTTKITSDHTLTGLTPSSVMYRANAGREEMSPGVDLQSLSSVTHSGCP